MSVSISDQQRVYTAYKGAFSGQSALIRQPKAIKKHLNYFFGNALPCVGNGFSKDNLVNVIEDLLHRGIFQKEDVAKTMFPALFKGDTSTRNLEAASSSKALPPPQDNPTVCAIPPSVVSLASSKQGNSSANKGLQATKDHDSEPPTVERVQKQTPPGSHVHHNSGCEKTLEALAKGVDQKDDSLPPLSTISVPFQAQHLVLTNIQRLLEESCFDFAKIHLNSLLIAKGWDCAAAGELNLWMCEFLNHKMKLSQALATETGSSLEVLLVAVSRIRHAAVHREHHDAGRILQMIQTSIEFLGVLSDIGRKIQLESLSHMFSSEVHGMRVQKDLGDKELKQTLQDITKQRAQLDQAEKDAHEVVRHAEAERKKLAGLSIEEMTTQVFSAPTKNFRPNVTVLVGKPQVLETDLPSNTLSEHTEPVLDLQVRPSETPSTDVTEPKPFSSVETCQSLSSTDVKEQPQPISAPESDPVPERAERAANLNIHPTDPTIEDTTWKILQSALHLDAVSTSGLKRQPESQPSSSEDLTIACGKPTTALTDESHALPQDEGDERTSSSKDSTMVCGKPATAITDESQAIPQLEGDEGTPLLAGSDLNIASSSEGTRQAQPESISPSNLKLECVKLAPDAENDCPGLETNFSQRMSRDASRESLFVGYRSGSASPDRSPPTPNAEVFDSSNALSPTSPVLPEGKGPQFQGLVTGDYDSFSNMFAQYVSLRQDFSY